MSWPQVATAAGVIATGLFVLSALPMLVKAARTKDLASYSPANLVVANVGNLAQTLYLTVVPPGPIWALHAFNFATSAIMLLWWIRHRPGSGAEDRSARSSGQVGVVPGSPRDHQHRPRRSRAVGRRPPAGEAPPHQSGRG